jgi:hydrogenase/urease accessory protein HupE
MQMKLNQRVAGILAGIFLTTIASAHPGHSPTDVVAEVSQPWAGLDHLLAFVALTSVLLVAVRLGIKARDAKRSNTRR